jgi:hypothetical protein
METGQMAFGGPAMGTGQMAFGAGRKSTPPFGSGFGAVKVANLGQRLDLSVAGC